MKQALHNKEWGLIEVKNCGGFVPSFGCIPNK